MRASIALVSRAGHPTAFEIGQGIAMRTAFAAIGAAVYAIAPLARADVTYVVQRGHTVEAIAHRYHVSVQKVLQANHLDDGQHLKPGQTLVIPGVDEEDLAEARARNGEGESYTIHAARLGEQVRIRVKDTRGHIPHGALESFEHLMRQGNATHPADPRLLALVGIVSRHFGSKTIEVVSGYRAPTPTQHTPNSRHNYGRALDFRIQGVRNEAVRDFCRTLRNVGCGYYPNSTFVHLDVREAKAFWVDWSRPGELPRYEKPGTVADEGTSDVTPGSTDTHVDPVPLGGSP
jgi:uncharacterized protein YcbK (DUF882 family)